MPHLKTILAVELWSSQMDHDTLYAQSHLDAWN